MELIKVIPFNHDDKEYEVGIFVNKSEIIVQALKNRKKVNGYMYSVERFDRLDTMVLTGEDILDHLIHMAMEDVQLGRWEKLINKGEDCCN